MRILTEDELLQLEEDILDRLWGCLCAANTNGALGLMLNSMGLSNLAETYLRDPDELFTLPEGKILVVGALPRMEVELRGVAKQLGISPDRVEFLRYEDTTNYNFHRLAYNYSYCAILFGHAPHSARGKSDDSSIITHIESNRDRYPTCLRLYAGGENKATKTSLRNALVGLMDDGLVVAA